MKLFVRTNGDVEFVYSDVANSLPIGNKDNKTISRASNVEFNHEKDRWEAIDNKGILIAFGPNRDEVIKEEVRVITERLRQGIPV